VTEQQSLLGCCIPADWWSGRTTPTLAEQKFSHRDTQARRTADDSSCRLSGGVQAERLGHMGGAAAQINGPGSRCHMSAVSGFQFSVFGLTDQVGSVSSVCSVRGTAAGQSGNRRLVLHPGPAGVGKQQLSLCRTAIQAGRLGHMSRSAAADINGPRPAPVRSSEIGGPLPHNFQRSGGAAAARSRPTGRA